MEVCPECGSRQITIDKGEKYCSKCGLVLDRPFHENISIGPETFYNTSTTHRLSRRDFKYLSQKEIALYKLDTYLAIYTNGLPKEAKARAKNLALKIYKTNLFPRQYKAIALACAQAAAEEINCTAQVLKNACKNSKLKKRAREIIAYMKKEKLYHPPSPREKVKELIRARCALYGYNFDLCLELYYKYEKYVSNLSPHSIADVTCYLFSIIYGYPPPPPTEKRVYRARRYAKKILKADFDSKTTKPPLETETTFTPEIGWTLKSDKKD